MAVTCVDGQGQAPHITGADKGRLHAGIFGEKSVVLAVGKRAPIESLLQPVTLLCMVDK